jgi:hypothetical protein
VASDLSSVSDLSEGTNGVTRGGPWADEEVAVLAELIQEFPERDASGARVKPNQRYSEMKAALAKRLPGNARGKTELRDQVKRMAPTVPASSGGKEGPTKPWSEKEVEVLKALIVEFPETDAMGVRTDANTRYSSMKSAFTGYLPESVRGKTELRDQVRLMTKLSLSAAGGLGGRKGRPWGDEEIEVLKELMVEFPEKDPATGQRADANARYGNMKRELGERLPESAARGKTEIRDQCKVLKGSGVRGMGAPQGGIRAPTDSGIWSEEEIAVLKVLLVEIPEKVRRMGGWGGGVFGTQCPCCSGT